MRTKLDNLLIKIDPTQTICPACNDAVDTEDTMRNVAFTSIKYSVLNRKLDDINITSGDGRKDICITCMISLTTPNHSPWDKGFVQRWDRSDKYENYPLTC